MLCVWADLKWLNGPFPSPLGKIKDLLTAVFLFSLGLCEMIFDDLSLHVPFRLKCFFISELLIIIFPLHTPLAGAHQLHTTECQIEYLTLAGYAHC